MISVIVPARNASDKLGECLKALLHQEGMQIGIDYEVIVVDDGSLDNTAEIARQYGVRLIQQTGKGPASARNLGANASFGELLAFTDADCAPGPYWISTLAKVFDNPEIVGVKGAYRTRQSEWVARFVQLEYEYKYLRMTGQYSIDFIDTYSAAYRKQLFSQNGGFDEAFPVPSVEDQEFSFRLARKGYRMVFEPEATVYHHHDRNVTEYIRRKFGIGYWKSYMLRWIPEKTFSDSHTAPTQRLEILLLGIMIIVLPGLIIWPSKSLLALLSALLIFLVAASSFLKFVATRNARLLIPAFGMLFIRAAALGLGLFNGFIRPPKAATKKFRCQSIGLRMVKRGFDILAGAIGCLLSAPAILLSTIAILIDSPGPIFYRQARAGEYGKPFIMLKLRTMVVGADKKLSEVLNKNPLKGAAFKIPADPRVTRVGRFLRRWSLDELPQFWNVLVGEMSLVGPRPEELQVVAQYNDFERQRLMVKPGLTGPSQVSGRGGLDFDQRLQLELDYLTSYSLHSDFMIILKTFRAIFSGEGIS